MISFAYLSLFALATGSLGATRHTSQACWKDTPCSGLGKAIFSGEWDANYFAPASRNVTPLAIHDLAGGRKIANWPTTFTFSNRDLGIYLDFGKEVGGLVTIDYSVSSVTGSGSLGLAFSEAKNWIGRNSDSSNGNYARSDGAIYSTFSSPGQFRYVMPLENLRGGFRYMTLFLLGQNVSATISSISLELSFQPTWSNLRAYQGYFHSNDDLLNKIWYSGAYTLQVTALHPSTGRSWPSPPSAWQNNGLLGPGNTINTDGAKRDRTVWPGDMGVAGPASFYSTGDLEPKQPKLNTIAFTQANSGLLPFSGPPLSASGSDTYHMWTMIGLYNYVLYSGDVDFLNTYWANYKLAMSFVLAQINPEVGLMNISNYPDDWGRFNSTGFLASAQMIAYHTLITGATLATWTGDTTGLNKTWLQTAANLKASITKRLWDANTGAFKDNYGVYDTGLHAQDGNSLALLFGVVDAIGAQGQAISTWLTKNWRSIGPESPELPGEVSPFITSFEIQAHLLARQPRRALDVIRRSWGWYLANENGTQSTMIEGYLTDGTFGYRHNAGYAEDYSYTSHAHGWSTGPVTALTEHVLGLSVVGLNGEICRFAPQLGDLTHVQGGFVTGLGEYRAKVGRDARTGCTLAEVDVPIGISEEIVWTPGSCRANHTASSPILVDGEEVGLSGIRVVDGPGGAKLYSLRVRGGNHTFEF
ncbi:glycoside hydrolase family 78 protein [Xylaria sp. CBS 124048]|nr:glycoside hydrolase family 78 protein [Xylaria sp. CBS 124048]